MNMRKAKTYRKPVEQSENIMIKSRKITSS